MNNTGIIRKIDGMGRLVIPKELRERYNIKDNDYLEFLLANDGLHIRKYSKLGRVGNLAQELVDTLFLFLNAEVFISESDKILAYSGKNKKEFIGKNISNSLIKSLKRRENLFEQYNKELEILPGKFINCSYINKTIVANCEEVGILTLYRCDRAVDEVDLKIIDIVVSFLSRCLEE